MTRNEKKFYAEPGRACLLMDRLLVCACLLGDPVRYDGRCKATENTGLHELVIQNRVHVAAKKYFCAVDEHYFVHLSEASVQSLQVQGGPMTQTEIEMFESSPYHQYAIQIRRYDDDGKVAGLEIKPVDSYRDKLESLLLD